jgi:TfoX N-terminal domain
VAFDEKLANRIRELIGSESDLTEQKMFGGLAFLIGGNMAVAASGQGGALVRVDPKQSDTLVATTKGRPMEMRGRQMRGWLRGRSGGFAHQTPARRVGGAWDGVRPFTAREAIDEPGQRQCSDASHHPDGEEGNGKSLMWSREPSSFTRSSVPVTRETLTRMPET